jgi:imidazolonepropionase-like amidohydrolase
MVVENGRISWFGHRNEVSPPVPRSRIDLGQAVVIPGLIGGALRAATVGGAEACGVQDVKGALAVGKQPDFAVLSGDPFDPSTRVLETWVAGACVHDPARIRTRPRKTPTRRH